MSAVSAEAKERKVGWGTASSGVKWALLGFTVAAVGLFCFTVVSALPVLGGSFNLLRLLLGAAATAAVGYLGYQVAYVYGLPSRRVFKLVAGLAAAVSVIFTLGSFSTLVVDGEVLYRFSDRAQVYLWSESALEDLLFVASVDDKLALQSEFLEVRVKELEADRERLVSLQVAYDRGDVPDDALESSRLSMVVLLSSMTEAVDLMVSYVSQPDDLKLEQLAAVRSSYIGVFRDISSNVAFVAADYGIDLRSVITPVGE